MNSILNEIKKIRNEENLFVDTNNSNRYRIIVDNQNNTYSAYYFSAPIYNEQSKKLVTPHFTKKDNIIYYTGSNAEISIKDSVIIKNKYGMCTLSIPSIPTMESEQLLRCNDDYILPTKNGIVYKADITNRKEITIELKLHNPNIGILSNDNFFAIMRSTFRPFITISSLGVFNNNQLSSPAIMSYQQIHKDAFKLKFNSFSEGDYLLIDINLHEPKLIQDTTVESLHPKKKNAFGEVAFIGNTDILGTQWLYIRPEMINMIDFFNKDILKVKMYLPKLNNMELPINAYKTVRRFCSFGSDWDNKVGSSFLIGDIKYVNNFATLDITNVVKNYNGLLGGIVLKPGFSDTNHVAIATGDCYCYTPIIEVMYKSKNS